MEPSFLSLRGSKQARDLSSTQLNPCAPLIPPPGPGSNVKLSPVPSGAFKPRSRVVVSITSLPHDLQYISDTLYSLGNQTLPPDQIYINLPYRSKRLDEEYVIPEWLTTWPNLKIVRSEIDYGPLTKLVPTLWVENDPNTIIVTMDNDMIYDKETLKHTVWYAEQVCKHKCQFNALQLAQHHFRTPQWHGASAAGPLNGFLCPEESC